MIGYLIAGILLLLFNLPVGVRAEYGQEGAKLWLRLGPVSVKLLPARPRKKSEEKTKKTKNKKAKKKKQETNKQSEEKSLSEKAGGAVALAKELLPVLIDAAGQFRKKLRVDELTLRLTVPGADDPVQGAMLYGQANALLGVFWATLNEAFAIADGSARIHVDFQAEKLEVYALGSLSLRVGQGLKLGVIYGIRALAGFLRNRKRQKSGKVA